MAKTGVPIRGTNKERETFKNVHQHYTLAKDDLEARIPKFDEADELFRSYIDKTDWPYNSVVFDPRTFTTIFEKTSRLFARKPRGKLVPREGGDAVSAQINNELLNFQWDDNERVNNQSMLAKWAMMDMNARKYGASFALCKWRYERQLTKDGKKEDGKNKYKSVPYYDGPDFEPLVNRDVLVNPSYSTVKNWFQHREYLTLKELESVNDEARSKPVYKNLDILRQSLKEESGGDSRSTNYTIRNKTIKDLEDKLGQDETNKVVEIITEYRSHRWITFAPRHGIVLRDIENPYDHGQIPVVMLRYYPIDDDIYGLSEIEPYKSLQKGTNALINQYLDAINMSLYTPLKIRANSVQMHTLEFGPGKKWIMNNPAEDVVPHDQNITGVSEFNNTYGFMISALLNGAGESSQGISNISPFEGEKTATEVRDTAMVRNARDNFNQIMLSDSMKKQMMFWLKMNQQFLFSDPREAVKVLRITDRESLRVLKGLGLNERGLGEESQQAALDAIANDIDVRPDELETPLFPVELGEGGEIPKMNMAKDGETASIVLTPEDLSGTYDFIPDVQSMTLPTEQQQGKFLQDLLGVVVAPTVQQLLAQEGTSVKMKELLEDAFEMTGVKDPSKYFEAAKGGKNAALQGGGVSPQRGAGNSRNVRNEGVERVPGAMAQGQEGPVLS